MKSNRMIIHFKRHMILLEVLIALMLVALCALPLIYPHVAVLIEQKKFIKTIKLDHAVTLMYAEIFDRMQRNEIDWSDIHEQRKFDVDDRLLQSTLENEELIKSFSFKGSYQFGKPLHSKGDKTLSIYLVPITFTFTPRVIINKDKSKLEKELKYSATFFVAREHPEEISKN